MSNTPPIQITPTGVIVPSAVDIRTGILADTNQAFGGALDVVTPSTPQAYLADNLTDNLMDSNAAIANLIAMVDPATSEGRFQDGIGRIYFFDRKGATSSVVQALCTGQPGLVMPAGQLAQDADGNLWISDNPATFDGVGQATIQFSCQTKGPIELGIGALTKIAQLFPGWDAITNLSPAIVGSNVESRGAFEQRRQESVARNGHGSLPSVRAEVFAVDGVLDVFAYQNFTKNPLVYGATNYELKPNSIYIGVVGGADQEIAEAIFRKLNAGCDMNGNTTVTIQDKEYTWPYPEYVYTFNRPTPTPVKFKVTIANNASLPATIIQDTKNAVIATFTGENGAQRARIGGKIFASNYYAAVSQISNAVSILQIKVGITLPNLDSVDLGIDQSPSISSDDVEVELV